MSNTRRIVASIGMVIAMNAAAQAIWEPDFVPRILTEGKPYLPDYSWAGYRWSEEPLPDLAPTLQVTDYGARPDDGQDDTDGIRAAVAAASFAADATDGHVVVGFPAGRFHISGMVVIEHSRVVLQGAGSGDEGTVLQIDKPLWEMDLAPMADRMPRVAQWLARESDDVGSPFSWANGIVCVLPPRERPAPLVVATCRGGKRAGHTFVVEASGPIEIGRPYRLVRDDPVDNGTLIRHVVLDAEVTIPAWTGQQNIWEIVTVTAVDGNRVTVKEPLLHDVRAEWTNTLETTFFVEEVGIEGFRVECPARTEYGGHGRERGYNPFYLSHLRNGWMRDIAVDNADSGLLSQQCSLVTCADYRVTGEIGAHYGMHLGTNDRCLVRDFVCDLEAFHLASFNTWSHGSVFTHGRVRHGRLDQHGGLNHQNLFDDIVVRQADSYFGLFACSGGLDKYPHGILNTFWNMRQFFADEWKHDIPQPVHGPPSEGAAIRVVCVRADIPIDFQYYNVDAHVEGINQVIAEEYKSLFEYQLAKRLRRGR